MKAGAIVFVAFSVGTLCASNVVLRSDAECRVLVDGQQRGSLGTGEALELTLPPGRHDFEAIARAGEPRWRQSIDVTGSHQEIAIPLRVGLQRNHGAWKDESTGLVWAAADNGVGVSWAQARRYCEGLRANGLTAWRLPSIDELQSLVTQSANSDGYRVRGPLKLTGWAWSSTAGVEAGERWALDFGDGGRASVVAGDSGLNRAVCVRGGNETPLSGAPAPDRP